MPDFPRPWAACLLALLIPAQAFLPATARAAPATWRLDQRFATIAFATSSLGLPVGGYFTRFTGSVSLDPADPGASAIAIAVDDTAIASPLPGAAALLDSAGFFDAARYPSITFRSTAVRPAGPAAFIILGQLTIRGVSRPETMRARVTDRPGSTDIAITGTLHRADFGMTADRALIGDSIRLTIGVSLDLRTSRPAGR